SPLFFMPLLHQLSALFPYTTLFRSRCGCTMTAEKKKGKYVYYRCTGFRGRCGNTYIREEQLSSLLGTVITPIQIGPAIADEIATDRKSTRLTPVTRSSRMPSSA